MRSFEQRPRQEGGSAGPAAPGTPPAGGTAQPPAENGAPGVPAQGARRPHAVPRQGRAGHTLYGKGGDGAKPRFTQKQVRMNILLAALIAVLLMALLLAALLPGCNQAPAASSATAPSYALAAPPSARESSSYDKDANSIPQGEFADTMLPETEPAGDDYIAETLFLGDSNTERMLYFSDVTGVTMKNGIGISSMGIGSVLGLRCVRFSGLADMTMPQAVAIMQPRRIVINFGTNNVGMFTNSFITTYKSALKAIHDAYPAADIIIGSVFPIAQGCTYGGITQKGVDEFNLALVEMAQDEGYKFLNWSEAIKDAKTGYARPGMMVADGVHLSENGMEALFEYFLTHSRVVEDTRPKPLKAIPARLPTPEGLFPKPVTSGSDTTVSSSVSSEQEEMVTVPKWDKPGNWKVTVKETDDPELIGTQKPKAGSKIKASAPREIIYYKARTASPPPSEPPPSEPPPSEPPPSKPPPSEPPPSEPPPSEPPPSEQPPSEPPPSEPPPAEGAPEAAAMPRRR